MRPNRRGTREPQSSKHWRAWLPAALLIFGITSSFAGTAGQKDENSASQGLFLVARRGMPDPLFAKSVVLMLPIKDMPLLVGLIVNKPTRFTLHQLFPDSPAPQKPETTAYFGGPVDVDARSAIFQSKAPPKNATLVFGNVYVTFDSNTIDTLVENPPDASALRVFVGRSQWAPAQLENEMDEGGWYSLHDGTDPIFSNHPEGAWHILLDRAEPQPVTKDEPPSCPASATRVC
jgi:putative transcriptional regulator